jgi:hypothetical protein
MTLDTETMASHRAQFISTLLPNALAFGCEGVDAEREPLKVKQTHFRHTVVTELIFMSRTWILTYQWTCLILYISYSSQGVASNNQHLVNARSRFFVRLGINKNLASMPQKKNGSRDYPAIWTASSTYALTTYANGSLSTYHDSRLDMRASKSFGEHLRMPLSTSKATCSFASCNALVVSYSAFKVASMMVRITVRPTISVFMNVNSVWSFLESASNVP